MAQFITALGLQLYTVCISHLTPCWDIFSSALESQRYPIWTTFSQRSSWGQRASSSASSSCAWRGRGCRKTTSHELGGDGDDWPKGSFWWNTLCTIIYVWYISTYASCSNVTRNQCKWKIRKSHLGADVGANLYISNPLNCLQRMEYKIKIGMMTVSSIRLVWPSRWPIVLTSDVNHPASG